MNIDHTRIEQQDYKQLTLFKLNKDQRERIKKMILRDYFNHSNNTPAAISSRTGILKKNVSTILNRNIVMGADLKALKKVYTT